MRRPPLLLLLACAVYLLHRALVLHSAFDTLCLPNYELTVMGNVAKVAQDGWRGAPLHQFYDNCGGHLVTGLLAVPSFALAGESYLALKLVPVALGLATLVLIWLALARHFDRRAANLAAWLFVLAPPTVSVYSMLAKGNHFENLFFQLVVLALFLRMHASERKERWLFPFGLAAGFAIFFYFGSMAIVALCALAHLCVRGWRRAARDLALLMPGFLAGIAPLVYVHLAAGDRPGNFLDAKLGRGSRLAQLPERLADFVTDKLPRAGGFEDLGPIPGAAGDALALSSWALAWIVLLPVVARGLARALRRPAGPQEERARAESLRLLPLVAYLPFVALVVASSTFEFKSYGDHVPAGQFRYLVPHFTYAALLIGIAAARLHAAGGARRALGRVLAAAALASGAWNLGLVDWSFAQPGLGARYDGWSYTMYNNILLRDSRVDPASGQLRWDFERVARQVEDFERFERGPLWFGVGIHLANAQAIPGRPVGGEGGRAAHFDLAELLAPFEAPEGHPDLARGAGSFLRRLANRPDVGEPLLRERLAGLAASGHPLAPWVVEGLCLESEYRLAMWTGRHLGRSAFVGRAVPEELRWAWRRGQGVEGGLLAARGIRGDLELVRARIASLPPDALPDFAFGLGFGLAREGRERALPAGWDGWLPAELAPQVLAGFGAALRHALGEAAAAPLFAELRRGLDPALAAELERGMRWPGYPLPLR